MTHTHVLSPSWINFRGKSEHFVIALCNDRLTWTLISWFVAPLGTFSKLNISFPFPSGKNRKKKKKHESNGTMIHYRVLVIVSIPWHLSWSMLSNRTDFIAQSSHFMFCSSYSRLKSGIYLLFLFLTLCSFARMNQWPANIRNRSQKGHYSHPHVVQPQ